MYTIKISLAVSTPDAKFAAIVYREPFAVSFAKAASFGCTGVEVAIRDPKMVPAEELLRLAEKNQLEICAIGTGQAYGTDGLSFTSPDSMVRKQAVERVKEHIVFAGKLGASVILGLIRGKRPPEQPAAIYQLHMMDGFKACVEAAEHSGVDLAIEPINRYETNLLNTVDETLACLEELDSPRVGILVDTFHMNIEEPSIGASIRKAGGKIKHVHVADSNRWAPGYGHLEFEGIIGALLLSGYSGYLSAEILPYPDPDNAARKVVETLSRKVGMQQ